MVANNGKRGRTFSVLLETHINLFFSMSHIVVFAEKMKSRMAYRNIAPGVTLIHLLCIHKRISCVYTRDLLCMHNTLVHALGQGTQGPGPKQGAAWTWDRPKRPFWALAPGFPGPEHAQECCACTRELLCAHKRIFCACTRDLECV